MIKLDTSILGILKSIGYIILGVSTWLSSKGINTYVFYVLIGFMVMDMILGWIKASVVDELENPTSKKAKKGILTKAIMFVIPVVSGLLWGMFDKENAIKVVNVQLMALTAAEGYSNIANAYTIYTGELLEEFDAVTYVFKKTANKIKLLLNKIYN